MIAETRKSKNTIQLVHNNLQAMQKFLSGKNLHHYQQSTTGIYSQMSIRGEGANTESSDCRLWVNLYISSNLWVWLILKKLKKYTISFVSLTDQKQINFGLHLVFYLSSILPSKIWALKFIFWNIGTKSCLWSPLTL